MRLVIIYLMFGMASSYVDHALRYDTVLFWRDAVAWPIVALDRVVDLHWLLTQRAQDYMSLFFAAGLIAYAVSRFEWPSVRAARKKDRRPAL